MKALTDSNDDVSSSLSNMSNGGDVSQQLQRALLLWSQRCLEACFGDQNAQSMKSLIQCVCDAADAVQIGRDLDLIDVNNALMAVRTSLAHVSTSAARRELSDELQSV